jgi:hypothetical protein
MNVVKGDSSINSNYLDKKVERRKKKMCRTTHSSKYIRKGNYNNNNTYHSRFIPKGQQRHLRYFSETPKFYQNYLVMRNTAHVTGGKPIALRSQFNLVVSDVNPLVALYDIHGRKGEVLFFCSVPDTTRDIMNLTLEKRYTKCAPCLKLSIK